MIICTYYSVMRLAIKLILKPKLIAVHISKSSSDAAQAFAKQCIFLIQNMPKNGEIIPCLPVVVFRFLVRIIVLVIHCLDLFSITVTLLIAALDLVKTLVNKNK